MIAVMTDEEAVAIETIVTAVIVIVVAIVSVVVTVIVEEMEVAIVVAMTEIVEVVVAIGESCVLWEGYLLLDYLFYCYWWLINSWILCRNRDRRESPARR